MALIDIYQHGEPLDMFSESSTSTSGADTTRLVTPHGLVTSHGLVTPHGLVTSHGLVAPHELVTFKG